MQKRSFIPLKSYTESLRYKYYLNKVRLIIVVIEVNKLSDLYLKIERSTAVLMLKRVRRFCIKMAFSRIVREGKTKLISYSIVECEGQIEQLI